MCFAQAVIATRIAGVTYACPTSQARGPGEVIVVYEVASGGT